MKPKTRKIIIWSISLTVGLPMLVFIGFILFFAYMIGVFKSHPTDKELMENLSENKIKYEQLVTMFQADYPITIVTPTWQSPDDFLSKSRWDAYKAIFRDLNIDVGLRRRDWDAIWFIISARGLVTGGDSKGLMYKPINPVPLYSSLDQQPTDLKSGVIAYKKIDDNWYIVFDWDD